MSAHITHAGRIAWRRRRELADACRDGDPTLIRAAVRVSRIDANTMPDGPGKIRLLANIQAAEAMLRPAEPEGAA